MAVSKEGFHGFAKGHTEKKDKDLLATAKRETKEELNLKINKSMIYDEFKHVIYQYIHRKKSKRADMPLGWVRKEIHLFLCVVPEDVKISIQESEVKRYQWVPINQLEKILFKTEMKKKKISRRRL